MTKEFSDYFETIDLLKTLFLSVQFIELKEEDHYGIQVKGRSSKDTGLTILPTLKKIQKSINDLFSNNNSKIQSVNEELNEWIDYFNKEYSMKSKFWKLPEELREDDVQSFQNDLKRWLEKLYVVSKAYEISINDKSQKIDPILIKNLKTNSKSDLKDAVKCMDLRLYTPAYMLFLRVAEEEVKAFYKKITGHNPQGIDAAWGNMLKELTDNYRGKFSREVMNIFYNLKDKRNESQHPGSRFTKSDCDEIIHYLIILKKSIIKQKSI